MHWQKEWLDKRELTLNLSKNTTARFFKRNENNNYSINTISNEDIERKCIIKVLGFYLDKKLHFEDQIEVAITKLNKFCGIIYQMRRNLRKHQLSPFLPNIRYNGSSI